MLRDTERAITRIDKRMRYFMDRGGKAPFIWFVEDMPIVYKEEPQGYGVGDRIGKGLLSDRTPLVAEVWMDGDVERLSIVIPKKYFDKDELDELKKILKEEDYFIREGEPFADKSLLSKGLSDVYEELDDLIATAYIEYLVKKRVICFVSDEDEITVSYAKDLMRNEVAVITVKMAVGGKRLAKSSLLISMPKALFED